MKKLDLTNEVFGRLTVTKFSFCKNNCRYWECLCICGKLKIIMQNNLKTGHTRSCGCIRKEIVSDNLQKYRDSIRLPIKEANLNIILANYIYGAKKRNLCFELTKEEFERLILSNCYYCGEKPSNKKRSQKKDYFTYSGVDRKNNALGYTFDNCASCCGECNRLKGSMSHDKFIVKSMIITENRKKYEENP
jgi:hypothetical protein